MIILVIENVITLGYLDFWNIWIYLFIAYIFPYECRKSEVFLYDAIL